MDIELANAVAALRDELLTAVARAPVAPGPEGDAPAPDVPAVEFAVGPIELEFSVELRKDTTAKAGFKAWVVSGEVAAGVARAHTHRVNVCLTPRRPGGGDLLVSTRADASAALPGASGEDQR